MGCRASKKGWFKGGFKKKAWNDWKKTWADKNADRDDSSDRKSDLGEKAQKFDCGLNFKAKAAWACTDREEFDGWKTQVKLKECDVDLKVKKWGGDWAWKQGRGNDCDRAEIKFKNCKFDWKNCKVEVPEECIVEIVETVCDYPEPPVEKTNAAPEIIAPTDTRIEIDGTATGSVVSTVKAIDPDHDTLIFSIDPTVGDDHDHFAINGQTGEIKMIEAPRPWGSADGDSVYEIEVDVTDGQYTDSILLEIAYVVSA